MRCHAVVSITFYDEFYYVIALCFDDDGWYYDDIITLYL